MARTNDFPRVLWLVTSTWLAGCGRVGFGDVDHDPPVQLADAPEVPDARVNPPDAAPDAPPDSPVIIAPSSPMIAFNIPAMTTVCGAGTTMVTATVKNPGDADLVIQNMTVMGTSFQVIATYPLTIPALGSTPIQIAVLPAVIGTDVGGTIKTEQLVVEANIATDPVDLSTTVMGANLAITAPAPPQLAFSDASGGCPVQKPATIKNLGNLPATVNVLLPGEFAISGASSASIAAGGALTRNFRPFTSSACSGAGVIQYEITGANCGTSGTVAASLSATFNITGSSSSCFCS